MTTPQNHHPLCFITVLIWISMLTKLQLLHVFIDNIYLWLIIYGPNSFFSSGILSYFLFYKLSILLRDQAFETRFVDFFFFTLFVGFCLLHFWQRIFKFLHNQNYHLFPLYLESLPIPRLGKYYPIFSSFIYMFLIFYILLFLSGI